MNFEHLIPILASTVAAATPLIYASLGELIVERRTNMPASLCSSF
jgi:ABC-type uncharacterized transport system permease subunit